MRDDEARSAASRRPHFGWAPVVLGVVGAFAVVVVCDSIDPSAGETALLRWLRVCADHPIRGGAAIALFSFALRPRSRADTRSLGTGHDTLYHARHIGRPEGR
jgi:hypothetical protein